MDNDDLLLTMLINNAKKKIKHKDYDIYSSKLNNKFKSLEVYILNNEIVISNFDEFISYMDIEIKLFVENFIKNKIKLD